MDLFDRVRRALSSDNTIDEKTTTDQDKSDDSGVGISFNLTPPEDAFDPDWLRSVLTDYYTVPADDADLFVRAIKEGYFEGYGYRKVARNADRLGIDLPREESTTIVWNEMAGITTRQNIRRYRDQTVTTTVEWLLPGDGDVSPICRETAATIENRGGSVTIDELQQILYSNAEAHDDGHPERVKHWVPHDRCRCSISPAFD